MNTLSEKMKKLETLHDEISALEAEIEAEVAALGSSQQVGRVKATWYPNGKGRWNWEKMALTLGADGDIIEKHTKTKITIGWQKIVEEMEKQAGKDMDFREEFYTPGKPFVSISVK